MYKKITSTELKQNTRKVLNQVVKEPQEPVVVYNYNEPKVVILSYEMWEEQQKKPVWKKPTLEELSKYFISTEKVIDSAAEIRKMRDEE